MSRSSRGCLVIVMISAAACQDPTLGGDDAAGGQGGAGGGDSDASGGDALVPGDLGVDPGDHANGGDGLPDGDLGTPGDAMGGDELGLGDAAGGDAVAGDDDLGGDATGGDSAGGDALVGGDPLSPGDADIGPPPVRFVVLGDGGEGNPAQYDVAGVMETVCAARGCDFALYLGDNIYNTGVTSNDDEQFDIKFEQPYANLSFPFYVVLGNHDYGGEGIGVEFWKADFQIAYTALSSKWTMPARYYSVEPSADVRLFGLDTTAVMFNLAQDQAAWLAAELPSTAQSWRIGFGHHPYVSNGQHGNAGAYEGIPDWLPLSEIPRGDFVEDFMQNEICGQVDVFFSGHDHNRQWLDPTCGTLFVVSGAAAKTTAFRALDNPTQFADDTTEGFLWVEIEGDTLTGAFFDRFGNEQFVGTYQR